MFLPHFLNSFFKISSLRSSSVGAVELYSAARLRAVFLSSVRSLSLALGALLFIKSCIKDEALYRIPKDRRYL